MKAVLSICMDIPKGRSGWTVFAHGIRASIEPELANRIRETRAISVGFRWATGTRYPFSRTATLWGRVYRSCLAATLSPPEHRLVESVGMLESRLTRAMVEEPNVIVTIESE